MFFLFQAEDGIRAAQESRWLGDVYKRQVMRFPAKAVIAMEACATSHYWGRRFQAAGYIVKLIAPQYVKPFVKSQKLSLIHI